MPNEDEKLSAILAEMTEFCSGWSEDVDVTVKVGLIYGWKCRIEAAAERERNAHTNDIHDALYLATGIPCNAAALRSALESIEDDCRVLDRKDMWEEEGECYYDALRDIREKVSAALAAPARYCDVGTAAEQKARYDRFCSRHYKAECVDSQCFGCPAHDEKTETDCEFVWGQLPFAQAEGGAK